MDRPPRNSGNWRGTLFLPTFSFFDHTLDYTMPWFSVKPIGETHQPDCYHTTTHTWRIGQACRPQTSSNGSYCCWYIENESNANPEWIANRLKPPRGQMKWANKFRRLLQTQLQKQWAQRMTICKSALILQRRKWQPHYSQSIETKEMSAEMKEQLQKIMTDVVTDTVTDTVTKATSPIANNLHCRLVSMRWRHKWQTCVHLLDQWNQWSKQSIEMPCEHEIPDPAQVSDQHWRKHCYHENINSRNRRVPCGIEGYTTSSVGVFGNDKDMTPGIHEVFGTLLWSLSKLFPSPPIDIVQVRRFHKEPCLGKWFRNYIWSIPNP